MVKRLIPVIVCGIFFWCFIQAPFARESGSDEKGSITEEDVTAELREEKPAPVYITSELLTPEDVKPALIFYIIDDINRKFSGLITNLRLEKIYGIAQESGTATAYFDYSYTSTRNKEKILYEKGKMTFIRFNSGKWFNVDLSIYLMDSYPSGINTAKDVKEE